eukprot:g761.t1
MMLGDRKRKASYDLIEISDDSPSPVSSGGEHQDQDQDQDQDREQDQEQDQHKEQDQHQDHDHHQEQVQDNGAQGTGQAQSDGSEQSTAVPPLLPGTKVQLHSLVADTSANGRIGQVLRYDEAHKRYDIVLERSSSRFFVLEKNIKVLSAPASNGNKARASSLFYLAAPKASFDRNEQDAPSLSLSEIFCGEFTSALFANYVVDPLYLFEEIPQLALARDGVVLACDRKNFSLLIEGVTALALRGVKNINACKLASPDRYGIHHGKIALIIYETGIRVVVFTCNMIQLDWQHKVNAVWVQDFPRLASPAMLMSEFGSLLAHYVASLGGRCSEWASKLLHFDFSSAVAQICCSIPGSSMGNACSLRRLGSLIPSRPKLPIVCLHSSFGKLGKRWFDHFQAHAGGGPLKIIWPTRDDVANSNLGLDAGGSIFLNDKFVNQAILEKLHLFHCIDGKRKNFTPHMKCYLQHDEKTNEIKWLLLTSANMSPSAFGYAGGKTLRSWEFGVVFRADYLETVDERRRFSCTPGYPKLGEGTVVSADTLRQWTPGCSFPARTAVLPVPFAIPPAKYGKNDRPWVTLMR